MINTWNIPSGDYYYISDGNAASPSWAIEKAIVQSTTGGVTTTTICFSRPFSAPSAGVSQQLGTTINLVWAAASNGVAGDFGQSHLYRG